jgi:hypothetical protein
MSSVSPVGCVQSSGSPACACTLVSNPETSSKAAGLACSWWRACPRCQKGSDLRLHTCELMRALCMRRNKGVLSMCFDMNTYTGARLRLTRATGKWRLQVRDSAGCRKVRVVSWDRTNAMQLPRFQAAVAVLKVRSCHLLLSALHSYVRFWLEHGQCPVCARFWPLLHGHSWLVLIHSWQAAIAPRPAATSHDACHIACCRRRPCRAAGGQRICDGRRRRIPRPC